VDRRDRRRLGPGPRQLRPDEPSRV
jgi:hypothetical protein